MISRSVFLDFHLDTNRINSRAKLSSMNILEQWHERDVIYLEMSAVAQSEAVKNRTAANIRKAYNYGATETYAETLDELEMLAEIKRILFPQGVKTWGEWNDVEIVFNASKYFAVLITDDGASKRQPKGILGSAEELKELGISVLRDHEAVELVKRKINERDLDARTVARETGETLPDWVGIDLDMLS